MHNNAQHCDNSICFVLFSSTNWFLNIWQKIQLLPRNMRPRFFESVNWSWLQTWQDSFEGWEILQISTFLQNIMKTADQSNKYPWKQAWQAWTLMHFSGSTLIWKIELICYNLSGGQQSYKRKNLRKTQYDSPEDSKVTLQVFKSISSRAEL